jgi:hypothetical protein
MIFPISVSFLLLYTLHAILHSFIFTTQVLTFEERSIELSKPVIEIQANDLRVSSSPFILNKAY